MKIQIRRSCFETNSSSYHTFIIRNHGGLVKYDKPIEFHISKENNELYDNELQETPEEKLYPHISSMINYEIEEWLYDRKFEIDFSKIVNSKKLDQIKEIVKEYTGFDLIITIDPNYECVIGMDCINPSMDLSDYDDDKLIEYIFNTKYLLTTTGYLEEMGG